MRGEDKTLLSMQRIRRNAPPAATVPQDRSVRRDARNLFLRHLSKFGSRPMVDTGVGGDTANEVNCMPRPWSAAGGSDGGLLGRSLRPRRRGCGPREASAREALHVLMKVRQVLRDVASCGLKRFVDSGRVNLVVLVDDPVPQAGTGGDGLAEVMGENSQPL